MTDRDPLMERRHPVVPLDAGGAERLLASACSLPAPRAVALLGQGHVNSNYRVELSDGRRIVLRICCRGEAVFRNEIQVLRNVAGALPVPCVYAAVCDPDVFEFPYMVLEWVDGLPLHAAIAADPNAADALGELVADILLRLRSHATSTELAPTFVESVRFSLFDGGADRWLGPHRVEAIWGFVQKSAPRLAALCHSDALVHGDLYGDNVLVRRDTSAWRAAALLDWEWAHRGCSLRDLGSIIRYDGPGAETFRGGLRAGFERRGAPLPDDWVKLARIFDTAAHCEKLAFPRYRGEVTDRSIRAIDRCLADYGTA